MIDNKYKKIPVCGYLHTNSNTYLLIHPHPIERDSWQSDSVYRFLVTEGDSTYVENGEYVEIDGKYAVIHPTPFHIVTTQFTIEYHAGMFAWVKTEEDYLEENND